jgi:hypothetical protein
MKKLFYLIVYIIFFSLIFISCDKEENTTNGSLNLSITDAPVDNSTVEGVYLTFTEIQYHTNDNEWLSFEEFEGPQKFNILELTNGESALLGSFDLNAGIYTQLRFILDAHEQGSPNPSTPGCYIEFDNASQEPLFVPSGSESGWKAVGKFTVPSNGSIGVTADFDARKSVFKTGSGMYILKPTIRLAIDNQAGKIVGGITNMPENVEVIVYAYEDGTYSESDADDPVDELTPRFANAITSDIVDETNNYHLAYLAPMDYDLVIVSAIEGEFQEVLGIIEDVTVESNTTTNQPIDLSTL